MEWSMRRRRWEEKEGVGGEAGSRRRRKGKEEKEREGGEGRVRRKRMDYEEKEGVGGEGRMGFILIPRFAAGCRHQPLWRATMGITF